MIPSLLAISTWVRSVSFLSRRKESASRRAESTAHNACAMAYAHMHNQWPPMPGASERRVSSLASLIGAHVLVPVVDRKPPSVTRLVTPLARSGATPTARFEQQVFNFLLAHRHRLGIADVFFCRNLVIDGLLRLHDGRFVLLEAKYRRNWSLACRAEWQIRQFLQTPTGHDYRARHAIVVFEQFSGDWAHPMAGVECGWRNWFRDYYWAKDRCPIHISLVRFSQGGLFTPPHTVVRTHD